MISGKLIQAFLIFAIFLCNASFLASYLGLGTILPAGEGEMY